MGTLSHVLHTGARPISVHEFADAVRATCPPRFPTTRTNIPRFAALAVSGGVDSMALAYLCSQLKQSDSRLIIADNPLSKFRAFVIDHGLRQESQTEAKAVAAALRAMGLITDVYPLYWSRELGSEKHPKELPNFESMARRLRYQKLGGACRGFNIVSLFLAHHQDDQYETVLMRLLQGHGVRGLRGMRAAADIPECEGMHGVYRSGYVDDQRRETPFYDSKMTKTQYQALRQDMGSGIDHLVHEEECRDSVVDGLDGYDFGELYRTNQVPPLEPVNVNVEDGGVMIYRPLLEFSKDRLIATCEANKIPWWEDKTNHDPTLTVRNAVRHMSRHHTLPVALQKPSVLALSRRYEQRGRALEAEADRLLAQTTIHVEPNTGTASVQFPEYSLSRHPRDMSSPLRRRARIQRQREVAGLLIKKVITLVSPEEDSVPLANLQNVISRLFPALSSERTTLDRPKAFGIAGVHFLPIDPSPPAGDALVWHLSRTPYPAHQPLPRWRLPYWHSPYGNWSHSVIGAKRPVPWMKWALWDGRFWIHVRHWLPYRVVVLPFLLEHAKAFREALSPADCDRLAALLKHYAPGKTRWTLPALYLEEDLDLDNVVPRPFYPLPPSETQYLDRVGNDPAVTSSVRWNTDPTSDHPGVMDTTKMKLIALPSLDVCLPRLDEWLEYEIRYRRTDRHTIATAGSFSRRSFLPPRLLRTEPRSGPAR